MRTLLLLMGIFAFQVGMHLTVFYVTHVQTVNLSENAPQRSMPTIYHPTTVATFSQQCLAINVLMYSDWNIVIYLGIQEWFQKQLLKVDIIDINIYKIFSRVFSEIQYSSVYLLNILVFFRQIGMGYFPLISGEGLKK